MRFEDALLAALCSLALLAVLLAAASAPRQCEQPQEQCEVIVTQGEATDRHAP